MVAHDSVPGRSFHLQGCGTVLGVLVLAVPGEGDRTIASPAKPCARRLEFFIFNLDSGPGLPCLVFDVSLMSCSSG